MITTFTKKYIDPTDVRREDIDIRDIAHSLALTNRFVGHTPRPINVAQHSVYVSRLVGDDSPFALQALLHDGSEAYLGDVSKWFKATPAMAEYRRLEGWVQTLVWDVFNCPLMMHESVEEADRLMVRFEAWQMYGPTMPLFQKPKYPLPSQEEIARIGPWTPWSWQQSEELFLERFRFLEEAE
jgi:hypothetical protein